MRDRSFTFSVTMLSQVQLFVVHLELIGSDELFASSVLDDSNDSFDSSNPFMMLGESCSEFDGCELDVEFQHNFDLRLC